MFHFSETFIAITVLTFTDLPLFPKHPVLGLRKALSLGVSNLIIEGSSEFVIKQMKGEWKVKSEVIKPYYLHAKDLCDNYFESVDFELIPASANNNVKELTQEAIVTKRSNLPGFVAEYS